MLEYLVKDKSWSCVSVDIHECFREVKVTPFLPGT